MPPKPKTIPFHNQLWELLALFGSVRSDDERNEFKSYLQRILTSIENKTLNIDESDSNGNTCLHHFIMKAEDNLNFLLRIGEKLMQFISEIDRKNNGGRTALMLACELEKYKFFELLLKYNAAIDYENVSNDVMRMVINIKNKVVLEKILKTVKGVHALRVASDDQLTAYVLELLATVGDIQYVSYKDTFIQTYFNFIHTAYPSKDLIQTLIFNMIMHNKDNIDDIFGMAEYKSFIEYKLELDRMKTMNFYSDDDDAGTSGSSSLKTITYFKFLTDNINESVDEIIKLPKLSFTFLGERRKRVQNLFPLFSNILCERIDLVITEFTAY